MSPRLTIGLAISAVIAIAFGVLMIKNANLETDLAQEEKKTIELSGAIDKQNTAIDGLGNAAKQQSDQAALAAMRTLNRAAVRRAAIKNDGRGPAAMNRWLHDTFRRPTP